MKDTLTTILTTSTVPADLAIIFLTKAVPRSRSVSTAAPTGYGNGSTTWQQTTASSRSKPGWSRHKRLAHSMDTIHEWFVVRFDEHAIHLVAHPPNEAAWEQQIAWEQITRICFRIGRWPASGDMFLSTSAKPDGYLIPIDADGGKALWSEIRVRGLFSNAMADEAVGVLDELFCSPRRTRNDVIQTFPLYSPRQLPDLDGERLGMARISAIRSLVLQTRTALLPGASRRGRSTRSCHQRRSPRSPLPCGQSALIWTPATATAKRPMTWHVRQISPTWRRWCKERGWLEPRSGDAPEHRAAAKTGWIAASLVRRNGYIVIPIYACWFFQPAAEHYGYPYP
jgi:hypothetical protein